MKSFRSVFYSALILSLGLAIFPLWSQEPSPTPSENPKNVIIVIRHAEDTDNWISSKATTEKTTGTEKPFPSEYWSGVTDGVWPQYQYPYTHISNEGKADKLEPTGFEIAMHALSGDWKTASGKDGSVMTQKKRDANGNVVKNEKGEAQKEPRKAYLGEDQARRLAAKLDGFLAQNGFAPIKRVITMDPTKDGSTPNPFDTLWPFVKQSGEKPELFLVNWVQGNDKSPGIMALRSNQKDNVEAADPSSKQILSPEGGSTIICWTGEGMEGSDGLLAKLAKDYVGEAFIPTWVNGPTARCSDIAVFYKVPEGSKEAGVVEKWKFASGSDSGDFEWKETIPEDYKRPGAGK